MNPIAEVPSPLKPIESNMESRQAILRPSGRQQRQVANLSNDIYSVPSFLQTVTKRLDKCPSLAPRRHASEISRLPIQPHGSSSCAGYRVCFRPTSFLAREPNRRLAHHLCAKLFEWTAAASIHSAKRVVHRHVQNTYMTYEILYLKFRSLESEMDPL